MNLFYLNLFNVRISYFLKIPFVCFSRIFAEKQLAEILWELFDKLCAFEGLQIRDRVSVKFPKLWGPSPMIDELYDLIY